MSPVKGQGRPQHILLPQQWVHEGLRLAGGGNMLLLFPQTHQGPHQGYARFLFFAPHPSRDEAREGPSQAGCRHGPFLHP